MKNATLIWSVAAIFTAATIVSLTPSTSGQPLQSRARTYVPIHPHSVQLEVELTPIEELLATVPVADPELIVYDVDAFGPKWKDVDRNGCDQRNDTLRRDLVDVTVKEGTNGCVALTGTLLDPYTGDTVLFERLSQGYQPVQIDHIVPRKYAAEHGALDLSFEQRIAFANDPLNLQTTAANQVKGDRGPATWMPIESYQCEYATRFTQVISKYELTVTTADAIALEAALQTCTP